MRCAVLREVLFVLHDCQVRGLRVARTGGEGSKRKNERMGEALSRVVAYHEAGHAVAADALGIPWVCAILPETTAFDARVVLKDGLTTDDFDARDLAAFGWAGAVAEFRLGLWHGDDRMPSLSDLQAVALGDRVAIGGDFEIGDGLLYAWKILSERWDWVVIAACWLEAGRVLLPDDLRLPGPVLPGANEALNR